MLDWLFSETGGILSAAWASDTEVLLSENDVVLTLYFAPVQRILPGEEVVIAFTENALGNGSALSFVNEGEVLELVARTEDGSILFEEPLWGDANGDGKITSADAALILRAVVGRSELDPRGAYQADADGDGEITAADAALILQYVVGLIDSFPNEP